MLIFFLKKTSESSLSEAVLYSALKTQTSLIETSHPVLHNHNHVHKKLGHIVTRNCPPLNLAASHLTVIKTASSIHFTPNLQISNSLCLPSFSPSE
jgi:hypothetical protein